MSANTCPTLLPRELVNDPGRRTIPSASIVSVFSLLEKSEARPTKAMVPSLIQMHWPLINSLVKGLKRVLLVKTVSGHIFLKRILRMPPGPPLGCSLPQRSNFFPGEVIFDIFLLHRPTLHRWLEPSCPDPVRYVCS